MQRPLISDFAKTEGLDKVEIISAITSDQVNLIFRRNISGITQRLGEIALAEDDDVEIDPIAWAGIAVSRVTELQQETEGLQARHVERGRILQKLEKQLDDLVGAKKKHEELLLEKFRELLNAKKLKIRDQQRLLAGAKVDPKTAAHIQRNRHPMASRTPGPSRPSKRKTFLSPSRSNSSSDFENPPKQEPPLSPARATPEHSDLDATADEDEDSVNDSDDFNSVPKPAPQALEEGKLVNSAHDDWNGRNSMDNADDEKKEKERVVPPRRELPFKKVEASEVKAKSHGAKPEATGADGLGPSDDEVDGDETSDDEL